MFDFQKDFRFTAPVKVLVPSLDGQQEKTFTAEFRLVPKEEMEKAVKGKGNDETQIAMRIALVGWKDDLTQKGNPWPFTPDHRDELLSVPYCLAAVSMAYWRQVQGVLVEKN